MNDTLWQKHAHTHAKHRARLHMECLNSEMAATILSEIEQLIALEFLYDYAYKNYHRGRYRHTLSALEAAEKIKREGLHIPSQEQKTTPLSKKYTPKDIFTA